MSKITITVSGRVGSGKSAICGEIEILCKALGLKVEWTGGQQEKNLTHADWTEALEMYKPEVTIIEHIEPAQTAVVLDDKRAVLPAMPSNVTNVMRRIRRCENEVAAQLVLEHFAMAYALDASTATATNEARIAELESDRNSWRALAESAKRDLSSRAASPQLAQTERALTDDSRDAARWQWARANLLSASIQSGPHKQNITSVNPIGDANTATFWDAFADVALTAAHPETGADHD